MLYPRNNRDTPAKNRLLACGPTSSAARSLPWLIPTNKAVRATLRVEVESSGGGDGVTGRGEEGRGGGDGDGVGEVCIVCLVLHVCMHVGGRVSFVHSKLV